jgi:hypothetical protein
MPLHLLTLKLQRDIPGLAGNYDKACKLAEAWRDNYAKSYDIASAADSYYRDKRSRGSQSAELMVQAIIAGKMKFVLTPSGDVADPWRVGAQLTVQEVEGVPTAF